MKITIEGQKITRNGYKLLHLIYDEILLNPHSANKSTVIVHISDIEKIYGKGKFEDCIKDLGRLVGTHIKWNEKYLNMGSANLLNYNYEVPNTKYIEIHDIERPALICILDLFRY